MDLGDLIAKLKLDAQQFMQGLKAAEDALGGLGKKGDETADVLAASFKALDVRSISQIKSEIEALDVAFGNVVLAFREGKATQTDLDNAFNSNAEKVAKLTRELNGLPPDLPAIKSLQSQLDELSGSLIKGGAALTAGITVPLVALAKEALSTGAAFEQAKIGFTTMLGSAQEAGQFLQELREFAAATPFAFPELVQTATRLKALGFEAGQVIPIMRAVGDAVAGLGGGQEKIDRITLALGQMQAKGKVSAQEMNQLAEAGIGAWDMLAKKIGVSIPEAMKMAEQGAISAATAIPAILEGMAKNFSGLMEAQMQTAQGKWIAFKEKLGFIVADIGTALLPLAGMVLDAMQPVLDILTKVAKGFADLPAPIQGLIVGVAALAAAAGPLLIALGGLAGSVSSIMALTAAIAKFGGLSAILATVAPVLVGITAAVAAMWAAWEIAQIPAVADALEGLKNVALSFWNSAVVPLGEALADVAGIIGSAVMDAFNALGDTFGNLVGAVAELVSAVLGGVDPWDDLSNASKGAGDILREIAQFFAGTLKTQIEGVTQSVNWLADGFRNIKQPVQDFLGKLDEFLDRVHKTGEPLRRWLGTNNDLTDSLANTGKALTESNKIHIGFVDTMGDLRKAVSDAEKKLSDTEKAYKENKASADDLRKAADDLQKAKARLNDELKTFVPGLEKAKKAQKEASTEYIAAEKALREIKAALDAGKPVQDQYVAAQQRSTTAAANLKTANKELKDITDAMGTSLKNYSGGIDEVGRKSTETGTKVKSLADQHKDLETAFKNAKLEYEDVLRKYNAGDATLEQLDDALAKQQVAWAKLNPAEAAEKFEKAVQDFETHQKKALADAEKFAADYNAKFKTITEEIQKATSEIELKFGKAHATITAEATKQIPILVSLYGQLAGGISAAAEKATDFGTQVEVGLKKANAPIIEIIDAVKKVEGAYKDLGIESATVLAEKARKAQEAYRIILESGTGSARKLQEAELEALKATIEAQKAAGEEITDTQKKRLEELEDAVGKSTDKQKNIWKDFGKQVSTIITDLGRSIADRIWDALTGKGNEQLDKQREDLMRALADQTASWEQYKVDVQEKLADIRARHAEELAEQLADLERSLADKREDYEAYVADVNDALANLNTKYDEQLAEERATLMENLNERLADYYQYASDVLANIDEIKAKHAQALEDERRDLQESLEDKKRDYDNYVQDVRKKLSRIHEDYTESIDDETRDTRRGIDDRTRDFSRYEQDTLERIAREQAKGAEANQQQIADWRESLEERRQDLALYIQRANEDLEEFVSDHQRRLKREEEDLAESLRERTEAYARFVQDANDEFAQFTQRNKEEEDKQIADLIRALERKREELAKYEANINRDLEAAQRRRDEGIAAEEAKLRESLARRTADFLKYEEDIRRKQDEARAKHAEQLAREEADIADSLARRQAEFEKYLEEHARKLQEIEDAHRSLWGTIGDIALGALNDIGRAITRIMVEALTTQLFDALKLSDVFDKIGGWIADKISGAISAVFNAGASAGGSVAGGAAGAAGQGAGGVAGAASSGLAGIVSAVSGVVSAVTGVISVIQGMGQSKSLGQIEENTRFIYIDHKTLLHEALKYWPWIENLARFNYDIVAPVLADIANRVEPLHAALVVDVKNVIIEVKDAVASLHGKLSDIDRNAGDILQMAITISGSLDEIKNRLLPALLEGFGAKIMSLGSSITSLGTTIQSSFGNATATLDASIKSMGAQLNTSALNSSIVSGFANLQGSIAGLNQNAALTQGLSNIQFELMTIRSLTQTSLNNSFARQVQPPANINITMTAPVGQNPISFGQQIGSVLRTYNVPYS